MRVRLEDPALAADLAEFLRRCGVDVTQSRRDVVVIRSRPAARLELDGYLRVWTALHRPAVATILYDAVVEAV